jgi:hypothetical protein
MLEKFQAFCIFETQTRQKSWIFPATSSTSSKIERNPWGNSAPNGSEMLCPHHLLGGSVPGTIRILVQDLEGFDQLRGEVPILARDLRDLRSWAAFVGI